MEARFCGCFARKMKRRYLRRVLPAVGLMEHADNEVDDRGIYAVFFDVECGDGRWADVCVISSHRRKEKKENVFQDVKLQA